MDTLKCDERRRITLTRELVEQYGNEFVAVPDRGEIVLIPVPKDPLKALAEEGKKIPKHLSIKDLKRMGRKAAEEEILNELRRH